MKAYSMTIAIPTDHRKHSKFVFGKYWEITNIPNYIATVRRLRSRTNKDKIGRILCIGRVSYDAINQQRLFVVKMGHNNILWSQVTPLGQQIKEKLGGSH